LIAGSKDCESGQIFAKEYCHLAADENDAAAQKFPCKLYHDEKDDDHEIDGMTAWMMAE